MFWAGVVGAPVRRVANYRVSSLAEVARFFGVAPDTIKVWRKAGMPGRAGAWDLSRIAQWDRRRADARKGGASGLDLRIKTAKAATLEIKRERELHALERERGESIALDVHWSRLRSLCGDFASRLERYPGELPLRLNGLPADSLAAEVARYFARERDDVRKFAARAADDWREPTGPGGPRVAAEA